jgi:hypothetical protein
MNVQAMKLVSGEEIVAEVVKEDVELGLITIKNPLAIMLSRNQTGDLNVGFVPFAPYLGNEPTIELELKKLQFINEVDEQMKNQYNSIFGGIITPPKQLITG